MKSLEYFRQAEKILYLQNLTIEDLGIYDGKTERFYSPDNFKVSAWDLIDPRTGEHYLPEQIESIRDARRYFDQFRKQSGFNKGLEKNILLSVKHLEQQKRLAALGFPAEQIAKIMKTSARTLRRNGWDNWQKKGNVKDEY